jgi:hypothetical protein
MELNILLQAASDEDEADEALEIANEFGIRRDTETYALVATHKARYAAFRALSDDMIEDGIPRNDVFYFSAIRAARGFSEACFLLGRMKADGIVPDASAYERLVKLGSVEAKDNHDSDTSWGSGSIAALIRRIGTRADIAAAGLDDGTDE